MLYSKQERVSILQRPIQIRLNEESKHQLKRRSQKIERKMKAIFIYPVAYVLIWIGPLIAHGIDYRHSFASI
jgi:G protein-coupled receptor GPR1